MTTQAVTLRRLVRPRRSRCLSSYSGRRIPRAPFPLSPSPSSPSSSALLLDRLHFFTGRPSSSSLTSWPLPGRRPFSSTTVSSPVAAAGADDDDAAEDYLDEQEEDCLDFSSSSAFSVSRDSSMSDTGVVATRGVPGMKRGHVREVEWPKDSLEDRYDVGEELGRGAFGTVRVVTERATYMRKAVKTCRTSVAAHREIDAVCRIKHPGVMSFHEVYHDSGLVSSSSSSSLDDPSGGGGACMHMVSDLYNGGDLLHAIAARPAQRFSEVEAAGIVTELLQALDACHRAHVLHLDVKPENAVLTGRPTVTGAAGVVLVDFGMAWHVRARSWNAVERAMAEVRGPYTNSMRDWRMRCLGGNSISNPSTIMAMSQNNPAARAAALEAQTQTVLEQAHARDDADALLGGYFTKQCRRRDNLDVGIPLVPGKIGSLSYAAPEVLLGRATALSDAWSVGVLLHTLLVGRTPWRRVTDSAGRQAPRCADGIIGAELIEEQRRELLQGDVTAAIRAGLEKEGVGSLAVDLVASLVTVDPGQRLSIKGAIGHPFCRTGSGSGPESFMGSSNGI